eukprot:m.171149 g.171149  ORF g.171149 m.171149 type:complete len:169 (-) comp14807_c0_seq2:5291-5797(-)
MASIVTVQVGQAGNQMGFEYLDTVARTALNDAGHAADHDGLNQHFVEERDGSRTARAVAVDMEPKVCCPHFCPVLNTNTLASYMSGALFLLECTEVSPCHTPRLLPQLSGKQSGGGCGATTLTVGTPVLAELGTIGLEDMARMVLQRAQRCSSSYGSKWSGATHSLVS